MRAFAEAWPETVIVPQPAAQLANESLSQTVTDSSTTSAEIVQQPVGRLRGAKESKSVMVQAPLAPSVQTLPAIVQRPVAQLPWRHYIILLDRLSGPEVRLWHAAKAVEHGWSEDVLALQIEAEGVIVDEIGLFGRESSGEVVLVSRLHAASPKLNRKLLSLREHAPSPEMRSLKNRPGLFEWLTARCCKFLACRMFLFEWKTSR